MSNDEEKVSNDLNIVEIRTSSPEKLEANRLNAQKSTGPRTDEGKKRSRRNSLKHGVSASVLITDGPLAEDPEEFQRLLDDYNREYAPVGTREERLVWKLAVCDVRENRAFCCEAELIGRTEPQIFRSSHFTPQVDDKLDRMMRYEALITRQSTSYSAELERLQRARKGEYIPAPLNVQVSGNT